LNTHAVWEGLLDWRVSRGVTGNDAYQTRYLGYGARLLTRINRLKFHGIENQRDSLDYLHWRLKAVLRDLVTLLEKLAQARSSLVIKDSLQLGIRPVARREVLAVFSAKRGHFRIAALAPNFSILIALATIKALGKMPVHLDLHHI
jgi:hypothetical protein